MSTESTSDRKQAMEVLAHAAAADIEDHWAVWPQRPAFSTVRGPETGLVMVRGRMGGSGRPFNLGEATVTRATVRLESGEIGHGYCLGRDARKALLSAAIDGMWQRDREAVERGIMAPLRAARQDRDRQRRAETAATRVDFFTMVRGEDQ